MSAASLRQASRTSTVGGRNVEQGDNVDVVRGFVEAFNEHDIEALIAYCDPQIEFHSSFAAPGGAHFRGHDGMRAWHRDMEQAWGTKMRAQLEALFDLGESVLVFALLYGTAKGTGAEAVLPIAVVATLHDGLVIDYKAYGHREDALEDLGVREATLEPIAP
jgi:ketosteroid isomerase-like protein